LWRRYPLEVHLKVNFNIEADQPIVEAEGRYRPKPGDLVIGPGPGSGPILSRESEAASNLEGGLSRVELERGSRLVPIRSEASEFVELSWTTFSIEDPKNPATPEIDVPGFYDLQVRIQGINRNWTEWYAVSSFGVNKCETIGIPLEINKGSCFTEIEYTDLVYVNPEDFRGAIVDGLILYNDFNLTSPYNGNDELYIINPFSGGGGEGDSRAIRLSNQPFGQLEGNLNFLDFDPFSSYEFFISPVGVVYDRNICQQFE